MLPFAIPEMFVSSILVLILIVNHGCLIQSHIFIYAGCSQDKYLPDSPYQTNLNSLLSSTLSSSSRTLYSLFALGNDTVSPPDAAIFSLYQCRSDLNPRDCAMCMADLINQIKLVCPYTYGATVQLDGCFLRYGRDDFFGKLDTAVNYNKCGRAGGDAEFIRRRDDVLADLQGAMGFRVSTAGAVEGYAQCLEDLTVADCSACLSDAVAKVKSECGSTVAGDMFLAQCYVRYWESGYYGSAGSSKGPDNVGKTVAIIVGVIGGVAVLIVLLSYCRKSLSKY